MRTGLDPRFCNITYDSNALDSNDDQQHADVERILELAETSEIILVTPKSVLSEIEHPNTPRQTRRAAMNQIFTTHVGRTRQEHELEEKIRTVVRGNAKSGKHDADVSHLSEAAKYGGYFITNDKRLIKKREDLRNVLPPSLMIVTPSEFLEIYDHCAATRPPPSRLRRKE